MCLRHWRTLDIARVTFYDATTLGYDSTGRQVWVGQFIGEGSNGADIGYGVATEPNNLVAVVGSTESTYSARDQDFLTILYSPRIGLAEQVPTGPAAAADNALRAS